jgi:hypothetical protein
LLTDPPFLKAFTRRLEDERSGNPPYEQLDLLDRIQRDVQIILESDRLCHVFEKHVLSRLPNPKSITIDDLTNVAFEQLGGVDEKALVEALPRFVAHLFARLEGKHLEVDDTGTAGTISKPFNLGMWTPPINEEKPDSEEPWFQILWDSRAESGFSFIVRCGQIDFSGDTDLPAGHIQGCLFGDASESAMRLAEKELRRYFPSILKSFRILAHTVLRVDETEKTGPLDIPARFLQPLDEGDELDFSILTSRFGVIFFSESISACIAPTKSRGKPMAPRIRNAIHLLAASDSVATAIASALCLSAVEALLCSKREGIVDELSRNCAAVFESDRTKRSPVIKRIKKLYDTRSRALHGESTEMADASLVEARRLAAGVLGAVIEWRGYQRGMDDKSDREKFLEHMEDAVISGRRMVGIREEFRNCLPTLD